MTRSTFPRNSVAIANIKTMNKTNNPSLEIFLSKRKVGMLSSLSGPDLNVFTLDEAYLRDPKRPTLSLSFKSAIGEIISKPFVRKMHLPNFFSNLLPEGHLRAYLAASNNVHIDREFFLLSALGKDLPGAVIAIPSADSLSPDLFAHPVESISEKSNAPLKFSLAGVQLKFSALLEAKGGLTIPVSGIGGDWIVKLPSAAYENLPENEYSMLHLAQAVGIEVPAIKLVSTKEIRGLPSIITATLANSLAVERFDRTDSGDRIHMEDFAQVFNVDPRKKYGGFSYNYMAKVLWVEAGDKSIVEFLRRLVFNLAIGNSDMHLKNWSLIYRDPQKPEIAPAYDFVSTIAYVDDPNMGLMLGRTKNMYEVELEDFMHMADKAGIPKMLVRKAVTEAVEQTRTAWEERSSELLLSKEAKRRIEEHQKKLPLFRSNLKAISDEKRPIRRKKMGRSKKAL